jgi:cell division protein ZapA
MPHVSVTIAGRSYRMACDEGQEDHLIRLGGLLNDKIDELRQAFGEIGDMRLAVMAGITVADELSETQRRLADAEGELARLRQNGAGQSARLADVEERVAGALDDTARRLERLAEALHRVGD